MPSASVPASLSSPSVWVQGPQALWLLLGAPWAEEVIFRLGLQARLQPLLGAAQAVLLSALAFGLAHGLRQPDQAAAWLTALPGLACGGLYACRGRVVECVALHAVCNLIWFLLLDVLAGLGWLLTAAG